MTFRGQSGTVTHASMVLRHGIDMADHYSQLANYMRLYGRPQSRVARMSELTASRATSSLRYDGV
jgi:hypothetical protein